MGKTPTILGVPMRERAKNWFELDGCMIQRGITDTWCAEVHIDGRRLYFEAHHTTEQAEQAIEAAIARIREAAARLGT